MNYAALRKNRRFEPRGLVRAFVRELDEEVAVRFVAVIPENAKIKAIRIVDASGKLSRMFVFPIGG